MIVFFFLFGLAAGSFLNSVIYRLDTGESLIKTRSHCPHCKKTLSWMELIPVVSFILQKGRCKHCKKPISWQYPLVEIATGLLFILVAFYNFNFIVTCYLLLVICFLIIIFVYDLKHYIIPDQVVYPAIVLAFGFRILNLFENWKLKIENLDPLLNFVLAAILAGAFFLVIVLISRGKWMGMGDVKLAVFMGLVLGWPKIILALFLAFLIGAFVSVILMILKKKTLKSEIPFGPFLAAATILTLFLGSTLIDWYLGLFY